MEFAEEFLGNATFHDGPCTFTPPKRRKVRDKELGAFVRQNGDVFFRVHAPGAEMVMICAPLGTDRKFVLRKWEHDLFEGTLYFDDELTGFAPLRFYVNNNEMEWLCPDIPVCFAGDRMVNYVEMPDAQSEYLLMQNVPHGAVSREVFLDEAGCWRRCYVYTPPGYGRDAREYPVLYLLGGESNETAWVYQGKMAAIFDNLLADRKCEPFMAVTLDTGLDQYAGGYRGFESTLCQRTVHHIDETYRTKAKAQSRALAGCGVGAMLANSIGLACPELFGGIGQFGPAMTRLQEFPKSHLAAFKNQKKFVEDHPLFFRAVSQGDLNYSDFVSDDRICEAAGVDKLSNYKRMVYPMRTKKWVGWRLALRDFVQCMFCADENPSENAKTIPSGKKRGTT